MEKLLTEILGKINSIDSKVCEIEADLMHCGKRLERLEKVDSIEHRVAVNQIDIADIKEIVEKLAEFQRDEVMGLSKLVKNYLNATPTLVNEELNLIHKRLDAQLNKIAMNEEAILIVEASHNK